MKPVLKAYFTNIGLLYSIAHIIIFSTTNFLNVAISIIIFFLCLLSVTLSFFKGDGKYIALLRKENAPLFMTGIALLFQSIISFFSGFIPQGFIAFGFALGNIIKVFELETEKAGRAFQIKNRVLRVILRPELMHSIANIALAYFSSAIGLYFIPILFVSLVLSFMPHWKGQKINYTWPRLLLTLYYVGLSLAALLEGNIHAASANALIASGSSVITIKMNKNFRTLNPLPRGLSLTKPVW